MVTDIRNKPLSNVQLATSLWWRMTWRQTLFAVFLTIIFYLLDGYDIYSTILNPSNFWGVLLDFFVDAPLIIIFFSLFSIFILKIQVWKRKINIDGESYYFCFSGSKKKRSLKTIEAIIVFIAISWMAWLINGLLIFLFWWIPGFIIVSYLVAKFIAIAWYIEYPLGKLKLYYCVDNHVA
ncbi:MULTISPECIES: hypothetical protein [Acidithiobacillus]|uniref:hypothetical protein n=1 Tax=Acidithiobacillus TaxID=119977 RepID=UPI00094AC590|nr:MULTISPECIES: hypothetical protein [Acidithiobacillus]MBE7563633.1 hypothetical protein [Acidithiobacillus sp. HP-6]MBE7570946.1 hypothetical protein [Acidithiobacillus sp. HP-2]